MTGTENSEGPNQNPQGGGPVPGELSETSKPIASLPNAFFLAYLVFLIFNIIRNTAAAIRPESAGTVIVYIALLFIPFAAVAAYNLTKGDAELIGKASILITAFFLVFAMVVELGNASRSKGRLVEVQAMVRALAAQRAAVPNYVPDAVPPRDSSGGKLAVPLKGSISIKMNSEPMKTVELADPATAHVTTVSPYELRVTGVKKGTTSLNITDRVGYKVAYEVSVE